MNGSRNISCLSLTFLLLMLSMQNCQHHRLTSLDWHSLHLKTAALLRDSDYTKIFPLDSLVFNSVVQNISDINEFAGFSLDCVTADFMTNHSDIYRMLRIIEDRFYTLPDSLADSSLSRLSGFYESLGLYRRAFEVFSQKTTLSDSLQATKAILSRLLARSESSTNIRVRDTSWKYIDGKAAIRGRLCDLLTVAPVNGWYDEKKVVEDGRDSLLGYSSTAELSKPIFAFLTGQQAHPHYSGTAGSVPGERASVFREISLESGSQKELQNLVQEAKDDLEGGVWTKSPVVRELILASQQGSKDIFSQENSSLFSAFYADNTLIFGLYDQNTFYIFIIRQAPNQKFRCYSRDAYDIERIELIDILGNGKQQLLVTSSAGSGGFFDAEIVDLDRMEDVFKCEGLYHGDLTIVDLDRDNAKELITTYAAGEKIVDCNQCPSRYVSELYDYDNLNGRFEKVDENVSSSELRRSTNGNMFGLSPLMLRAAGGEMAGGNIYILLDRLGKPGNDRMANSTIEKLWAAYGSEHNILNEVHDYTHAVILDKKLLKLFDSKWLDQHFYAGLKLDVYLNFVKDLFLVRDYESFHIAEQDAWYHSHIDTSSINTAYNYSLKGLVYLDEGKYGNAYDCFFACYRFTQQDDNPAAVGNLVLYFSLINDTASYYKYSLLAADKAIRSKYNIALNLFNVARAGAGKLTDEEQLDYLVRAIREAKGSTDGEQILMILENAAQLALRNGESDLALKLLDLAIEFTTSTDWQQVGAYIFLLYGQCMEQLHKQQAAVNTLTTAIKLAEGISRDAYITGCYELSSISFFK